MAKRIETNKSQLFDRKKDKWISSLFKMITWLVIILAETS